MNNKINNLFHEILIINIHFVYNMIKNILLFHN